MDSDSSDTFSPKLDDFELDDPDQSYSRDNRYNWTPAKTFELIKAYETECTELWDQHHTMYKNRMHRTAKLEFLANKFDTSPDEINRKLHNLRSQYCKELKKLKRYQETAGDHATGTGWEYFEAMSFLQKDPLNDTSPSDTTFPTSASMEDVKFELEQFQAQEQAVFCGGGAPAPVAGPAPRAAPMRSTSSPRAPATLPLTEHAHPILWPEDPARAMRSTDECQIFGDFVASELRILRSDECRKKLKRMIQKAILQVGEEDDESMKRRQPSYHGADGNDD